MSKNVNAMISSPAELADKQEALAELKVFLILEIFFGDLFGDIFGGGGSRRGRRSQGIPGDDLQTVVDVTFEEAAKGVEKTISVHKFLPAECAMSSGA